MELAFQHMELVLGAFLAMVLEPEPDSEVSFPMSLSLSLAGSWGVDVGFGVLGKREISIIAFSRWESCGPCSAAIQAKDHPSIHFSVHLSVHPFISVLSNYLSIHYPFTHLFIHPSTH